MLNFSEINIESTLSGIDPTPKGAKHYLRKTVVNFLDTFDRSIERWPLRPQDKFAIDQIVGRHSSANNFLGSNMYLRQTLGSKLIDLFYAMQTERPERRVFLVTLISDRWLSFDRMAQIWLAGMKNAMRQVLLLGGFTGWLGVVEVQTLDETVQTLGRILLPHGHFIAWSDDPHFCPEAAAAIMSASGRLESRTSAATVDVRVDPQTSACNIAAYLLKAPALAKHRVPSIKSPSGFALADCALPPVSAVRQVEVLSQVTFDELIFSGGDGGKIRRELIREMDCTLRSPYGIDIEQAARLWNGCRSRARRQKYKPVRIDRTGAQLPPNPPIGLACARTPRPVWIVNWLIASGQVGAPQFSSYIKRMIAQAAT